MNKQKKAALKKGKLLCPKYPVPMCFKCKEMIIFREILINPKYQMLMKYDCACKKKNMTTVFKKYYERLLYHEERSFWGCDMCDEGKLACFYCSECDFSMCEECQSLHQDHVLFRYGIKNISCYCKKHPKTKSFFYCFNCKKDFCVVCKNNKHKKHKVKAIKDYYEEVKKKKSILEDLDTILSNVPKEKKEKLKEQINLLYSCFYSTFIYSLNIGNITSIHSVFALKTNPIKFTNIIYTNMNIKNILRRPWVSTRNVCQINDSVYQVVLTPDQKIGFLTREYEITLSKFYLTDKYCRKVEAKISLNYRLVDVGVIAQDNFYLSNITTLFIIQLSGKSFKIIKEFNIKNSEDYDQSLIYIGNTQFLMAHLKSIQKIDLTTAEVKQIGEFSQYIDGWLTLLDDTKIAVDIDEEIQCMDIITGKIEKPFEIPETIKKEELTIFMKEVSKDKDLLFATFYNPEGYKMAFVCWNVSTRTIRYINYRKSLFDVKGLYLKIIIYNKDYTILHRNFCLIVVNNKTGEFIQVERLMELEQFRAMLVLAPKFILMMDEAEFLNIRG